MGTIQAGREVAKAEVEVIAEMIQGQMIQGQMNFLQTVEQEILIAVVQYRRPNVVIVPCMAFRMVGEGDGAGAAR